MTTHQRPAFWKKLRFACTQCGGCCRRPGYVELLPSDIERLLRHLEMDDITFFEQFEVESFGLNFAIQVDEENPCVFLEGDTCSVFEARPAQCRTYPFWPEFLESKSEWEAEREFCPGIGEGEVYDIKKIIALSEGRGSTPPKE